MGSFINNILIAVGDDAADARARVRETVRRFAMTQGLGEVDSADASDRTFVLVWDDQSRGLSLIDEAADAQEIKISGVRPLPFGSGIRSPDPFSDPRRPAIQTRNQAAIR